MRAVDYLAFFYQAARVLPMQFGSSELVSAAQLMPVLKTEFAFVASTPARVLMVVISVFLVEIFVLFWGRLFILKHWCG